MQQPMGRPVNAKTSLPPGIPGPPLAYLLLQVTLFRNTTRRALPFKHLAVRVIWWGEDSCDGGGLLLHPRIAQQVACQKEAQVRSHTRYPVCVPLNKMHSYLEDMGCLFLDVIDESSGAVIGRGKVDNLRRLTPRNPIKSVVAVANARGSKIGELTVSLSYELLRGVQSHGIRKKHQSLPRVNAMALRRLQSSVPQTSISNPTINALDTEDHNVEAETLFQIPTLNGTDESKVQKDGLDGDMEVKTMPLMEDNDDSTLSMEVVARIQSALEESRRIRQQVLAEINNDAERMDEVSAVEPNSPLINQLDEDNDLGAEKGDLTTNQTEVHPSPRMVAPQPEVHFDLLDGVNGLFDGDCWGDCTDTDLERDIVIDSALLPRHDVATQFEVNVSNQVEDLAKVNESGGEVVKETKKSSMENSPPLPSNTAVLDSPHDTSPSAIRLIFRRLIFPVQIWNAMGAVMTALVAKERRKCSNLANQHQRNLHPIGNVKGDEERRSPPRRTMIAHQLQKARLINSGGGLRARGGLQRPRTGRIVQKRLCDKSPIKGMSIQGASVPNSKSWDLYLEILVPTDLVDAESNTGLSFQPLVENLTLWCQCIHLCRGISKQSAPSLPSSPPSGDAMVIIVPQRDSNTDNSPPEPLVLSANKNDDLEILPIRLQLLCKPPIITPSDPIIMLIGSIELSFNALLSSLYQTSTSNPHESRRASPKTLRVCIDFAESVRQLLLELLGGGNSRSLLRNSFGFINVEPIWGTPANSPIPRVLQEPTSAQENLLKQDSPMLHTNSKVAAPPSSFQLDVLLNVREARDLRSPQTTGHLQHSFLVVRIPWCSEESLMDQRIVHKAKRFHSAISWGSGATPVFHFGLRASAILSEEQMARLSKAFIAIEVWERHTGYGAERDEIIGLAKVMTLGLASLCPLNVASKRLAESRVPLLQEEAWLQVTSPSTGQVCGQLRTRFAAGTSNQISVLLEVDRETAVAGCTDWRCIDFIRWKEPSIISGGRDSCCYSSQSHGNEEHDFASSSEELISISVKHCLDISLFSLTDFRPSLSESLQKELGVDMFLFNDCDCFIQYTIPSDAEANPTTFRSPLRPLQPLLQSADILQSPLPEDVQRYQRGSKDEKPTRDVNCGVEVEWKGDSWHESHSHTFVVETSSQKNIFDSVNRLDSLAFLTWLGRGVKSSERGIPFELWLRLYSPKLREICVARGVLPWDLLEHHLMPPPMTSSSTKGLRKLDDFLPEWSRDLTHHALSLFDVTSNRLSARLFLNIVYRLKSTIRHISGTIINDVGEVGTDCVLCHPRAALHLAPSTARPGIHLHVNLLALSGLEAAASSSRSGSARLQVRMHCLLLLPFKCSRHTNPPRLLATTVSRTPLTSFHANQEELRMRLDVLLPLGWTYATSPRDECLMPHRETEVKGNFTSFSLAEALAYGRVEIVDREAWLCGRVRRPCLVIQVDIWEMESVADAKLTEDQLTFFWNTDHDTKGDMKLRATGNYSPLASCRVPLSDLLFSGVVTPRWITLLRTPSAPFRLSEAFHCYRLAGAFEMSASFGAVSTRRKVLEEVISQASPVALQSLHCLGFDPVVGSVSRICLNPKNTAMNDERRQLTLHFLAARLPTEESLLNPEELAICNERGLQGCFFARAVLDSDFQISTSHPLPRNSNKLTGDGDRGVVMFEDSLTFCAAIGPRSKNAILEVQIWAKWLPKKDSSPRASAFDTIGAPAPRFLGFLQLSLFELLGNEKSVDLPEAFYWSRLQDDTTGELTSSHDHFPVYPLFQSSVGNLNDIWIALSTDTSASLTPKEELMHGFRLPQAGTIAERGVLFWFSKAQASKGLVVSCDTKVAEVSPTKEESFAAYVHVERANRLASAATRIGCSNVETFATFVVTDENRVGTGAQRVVTTPLATNCVSPVWNYRRFVRLPLTLVTMASKVFAVDFWERSQGETHPQHLGTATMQLSTLLLPRASSTGATTTAGSSTAKEKPSIGLEFVRGWYEILDDQGTSKGQVLMGVYPLAENEENAHARRLCPRLEALLHPGSAAQFQEMPIDAALIHRSKSSNFDPVPALTVSPPSSEVNISPSSIPQCKLPGSTEIKHGQPVASTSSLLTTLQSRLEELDIQNARFKQKLLELSTEPRELEAAALELRRADRPGKGCKIHTVCSPSPQDQQEEEVPLLSPFRTQHSCSADNFLFLYGTGDNNSRIRTASSASSITSKSDSSDGMLLDEEEGDGDDEDGEAEVLLLEGDSVDECDEIEEDNTSDRQIPPDLSHDDVAERIESAVRRPERVDQKSTDMKRLAAPRASVSRSPMKEVYNDDQTSIATASSSSSVATIASLGALTLKKHVSETPGSETIREKVQCISRKEGSDCPSTWSASSTDVEEYLQRFRQDLTNKCKPLTITPSQRKLVISEEEAETLTSLQTHACIARTISTKSTDERGSEADAESAEYDEPTGVGGLLDDDSASESATISLQPPRRYLPSCSEDAPWRNANAPVPHCHLQALKQAREAAESVRLQKSATVDSPSHLLSQEYAEDPIRQRIHANLSCLVRKTNLTTGDRLQRSEATAAAILKSASQDDSASAASTSSSSAASVQLSSRSLARAARIFEMKL